MITEFLPFLIGFDKEHRMITLVGRGDAAASFTSIADIAGKHAMRLSRMDPYPSIYLQDSSHTS
jgi:hypothetical protein